MHKLIFCALGYLCVAIVAAVPLQASEKIVEKVAKELTNPNTSLARLTFKNQYRLYSGDLPDADKQDNYTLLFQPAFPFSLGETSNEGKASVFLRPAFPIIFDPPTFNHDRQTFDNGSTALGDIGFDLSYGVSEKNGLVWAFGMVGTLPTATDSDVGGKQLRLGPEALVAKFEKWGIYGIFPNHEWDVSGWGGSSYSSTTVQVFAAYLLGGGWSVSTSPKFNYNWNSEEWTVPLQVSVGKTVMAGKTPVKLGLAVDYYVERPDAFAPEWMLEFSVTPVVPNVIETWIKSL